MPAFGARLLAGLLCLAGVAGCDLVFTYRAAGARDDAAEPAADLVTVADAGADASVPDALALAEARAWVPRVNYRALDWNIETVTAYGRIWDFKNETPLAGSGALLTQVAHYAAGPCLGKTGDGCRFDTHTLALLDGEKTLVEVITAYGKRYRFRVEENYTPHDPDNGTELALVPEYRSVCPTATPEGCRFDTQLIGLHKIAGGQLTRVDSIVVSGRYWNFKVEQAWEPYPVAPGGLLAAIPRYQEGPCALTKDPTCHFETRAFLPGDIESVTAYGHRFEWMYVGLNPVPIGASTDLRSVPRYHQGPCAPALTGGAVCKLDTRLFAALNLL